MAELEPALAPEAVLAALDRRQRARTDGAASPPPCTGQPELLTGQGARAPLPGVLRFISALARAGATTVTEPPCPRCGRQRQLGNPVDGLRVCGGCRSKARALRCGRCGKVRSVARRNDGGQPICQNCWHRDPRSWKPCAKCGNNRRVAAVTEAGPVCQSCRPGPDSSLQHLRVSRRRPDRHLAGDRHAGLRTVPQALDHLLALRNRGPAQGRHAARAAVRTLPQPRPGLLETMRGPASRPGSCRPRSARAARLDRLKQALTPPGGTTAPELDRLRETLAGVDRPDLMLDWLKTPAARRILQAVAASGAVTHEALDALPPGRALAHVRSMLVAAGALPARDERLTALETLDQPGHRRAG